MKYYIISGEASGDMHAANLVAVIKEKDEKSVFRAWGGDKLQQQGATIVKHIKNLAFMGFLEVIVNLPTILKNINFCKKDILDFQPDALILVDYPGFNFRIAKFAKQNGIKVFYYISPQIWAWKKSRIKQIRKNVDKMFVILPFEKEYYKANNFEVDFVGHPLLDEIAKDNFTFSINTEKPIIALLPGSRKQEISKILPQMLSVVNDFSNYQFIVATTNAVEEEFYKNIIQNRNVLLAKNETYGLLKNAEAALVTSGTATLETALFNIPQVVCYKTNSFSYQIAKHLVKTKFISLVNIIMDKMVVKELIQAELNPKNLSASLSDILENTNRKEIQKDYSALKVKLGKKGASQKVADLILKYNL
ncbi:MAG: lipid-A-disaccharide synthase [Flavobacteriales bacterium]|nr:lipid-A-disaccharide synthase [Flavobacteriales bacterium]